MSAALKIVRMTDHELIDTCLKGEERGYRALYERYGPVLMSIAHRYSADQATAEDIFQEAFIRIFQKLGDFKRQGSLEGWLKRVLVTTALNHLKKNKRWNESVAPEDDAMDEAEEASILEEMSANELMECIKSLPEGYRVVFNLYVIEGYDHKEIAEMLNITASTSRSQLVKAKKQLQLRLAQQGIVKSA